MIRIAVKSAFNRKLSLSLSIFAIALSVFLLLGVDKVRRDAKQGFINTISGTDLIVGSKSGQIPLLLYTVFQIGSPVGGMKYASYTELAGWPEFAWTVPITLGDSHRGFKVVATTSDYFNYYRYGDKEPLTFIRGKSFLDIYDVVIGHQVAQALNYDLGSPLVVTHGLAENSFNDHADKPFKVTGILDKTGTPVDRAVYVSLEGFEAIHVDWRSGARLPLHVDAETARKFDLDPKVITSFMAGLKNRALTFKVQRRINEFSGEPLEAIIPGVTLAYLWQTLGNFENILLFISFLVFFTGILGLLTTQLAVLNERRREMAVLRAVGAGPREIFFMFIAESIFTMTVSIVIALGFLYAVLFSLKGYLTADYGIYITIAPPDSLQLLFIAAAMVLGILFSLPPAYISYRQSLKDGLSVKL